MEPRTKYTPESHLEWSATVPRIWAILRSFCLHRCQQTGHTTEGCVPADRAEAHNEHGANETRRPPGVDGSRHGTTFRSELRGRKPVRFLESRPGARMPPNQ